MSNLTRRIRLTREYEITSEEPVNLEILEMFNTASCKKPGSASLISSHVELLDPTKEQQASGNLSTGGFGGNAEFTDELSSSIKQLIAVVHEGMTEHEQHKMSGYLLSAITIIEEDRVASDAGEEEQESCSLCLKPTNYHCDGCGKDICTTCGIEDECIISLKPHTSPVSSCYAIMSVVYMVTPSVGNG